MFRPRVAMIAALTCGLAGWMPGVAGAGGAARVPRDPLYTNQWALEQIGAPEAWETTTGDPSTIVAVLDTGADLDHPDLAPHLIAGYDFVDDDDVPDDENGHGTHVAGIIGAVTDNEVGVAGLNWQVQILPLRVADNGGRVLPQAIAPAIRAAVDAGAKVVNMSFSGSIDAPDTFKAIAAAPSTLFVAAAGNEAADIDVSPSYPCAYDLPNVVCVSASTREDTLWPETNTGALTVDLAAPGNSIFSTTADGGWGYERGTSMAAAYVSGSAALLLAHVPTARPEDLAAAMRSTAKPASPFAGSSLTGGRLDLAAAMRVVKATPKPAPTVTPTPTPTATPDLPTPTPTVTTPRVTPTPTAEAPGQPFRLPDPAKLKVHSLGLRYGALSIDAEITRRATGVLTVAYRAKGTVVRASAFIDDGKVRASVPLPRGMRTASGIATLTWAGSEGVQAATVRLRAANRPAALRRRSVSLQDGRLHIAGTIAKPARGRVRFELAYVEGSTLHAAMFSARVRNGRWSLDAPVPAAAAAAGGYLTLQFTGDATASGGAIRGEQDAVQVTPAGTKKAA